MSTTGATQKGSRWNTVGKLLLAFGVFVVGIELYGSWHLVVRAMSDSLLALKTDYKAIGLAILGAAVTALGVLVLRGWREFRNHVVQNIFIALGGALATWFLVFVFIAIRLPYKELRESNDNLATVIQEKQKLAEEVHALEAERDTRTAQAKTGVRMSVSPTKQLMSREPLPSGSSSTDLSPLERMRETDKRLTEGDRARLSDALFDFSAVLDRANGLWSKENEEMGGLARSRQEGKLSREIDVHRKALADIDEQARSFAKDFPQVRDKWKYFNEQTSYIFGDNPDNEGPYSVLNAVGVVSNNLERWAHIPEQYREQRPILDLLEPVQNQFETFSRGFAFWQQGSRRRLNEVKDSIK